MKDVCPYCKAPVKECSANTRHVNGIKPIAQVGKFNPNVGCEFCNPEPKGRS